MDNTKDPALNIHLENVEQQRIDDVVLSTEKVHNGDEALAFIVDHHEAFTPDEEKRVRRKIDIRLVPIMLVVNGIQFVDKLVRDISSLP